MKTHRYALSAAGLVTLGLLAMSCGCASSPTRSASFEFAAADPGFVPPTPIRSVEPFYPTDMKRAGISGVVHVNCLVNESGEVRDPVAAYASNTAFVNPALEAVRKWKFRPAQRDGVTVATRVNLPVTFTLLE